MSEPDRKNVLVVTLGGAPGVVTETAFALLDGNPSWVPHEIHLVTTAFGAKDWSDPASRPNRELAALFRHFGAPAAAVDLLIPKDERNGAIADIRTEEENVAFANALTWRVMEIKERKNVRLHMSMAGGRKTMSSYAQSAMQYFAEEADALTHTLVEPQSLEYHKDFFWPYQAQQEIVAGRDGAPCVVRADTAKIALVPSPFVRLRAHIKRIPFAKNNFNHWTLTERTQARLDACAPAVTLTVADRTVTVDGAAIPFGEQQFALYRVLAAAIKEDWRGVGPDGQGDNHTGWILIADFQKRDSRALRRFFEYYRDCFPGDPGETYCSFTRAIDGALASGTAGGLDYVADRFKSLRNDIKAKLAEGAPSYAARRGAVPRSESAEGKGNKYGLALEPHEIEIAPRARDGGANT